MGFRLDITPVIFGLIIIAVLAALFGMVAPEITKALSIQDQIKLNQAKSDAEIAKQNAQAAVAPTLAALDAQIRAAEVMSKTNALEFQKRIGDEQLANLKAERDAQTKRSEAESLAIAVRARADSERGDLIARGALIATVILALAGIVGVFLYQHGRLKIREKELENEAGKVEVIREGIKLLSESGGTYVDPLGHRIEFKPKLLPAGMEIPVQTVQNHTEVLND